MSGNRTFVLVTPHSCVGPASGGGQRTDLFFSALKRLGPTEVVVLGTAGGRENIEQHFTGHSGLHLVDTQRAFTRKLSLPQLVSQRIDRYFRFSRGFRPDPAVREKMQALLGSRRVVIVYRYFHNFCLAGHEPEDMKTMQLCVDLDDRDDQRLPTMVQHMSGSRVLADLYSRLMAPALRRFMRQRLSITSLVWLAADEDLTGLEGLPTAVAPNVPFQIGEFAVDRLPSQCSDVLFVGNFAPNRDGVRWFLLNCWPELHRRHPKNRFRIVGFGNWSELADEFQGMEGVDFVGAVDDLASEYGRARLVILPLFSGGGTKIKLIEGCAFGRPIVTTTLSARGFGPEIGALLAQTDTADGFVAHCSRFLADDKAADDLGGRLQALQREKFTRSAVERRIAERTRGILSGAATASTNPVST